MTMASVPEGAFTRPPIQHPTPSIPKQARSFLWLLWIEVRRSHGYWLLPLMVGLGLYVPVTYDEGDVVLWLRLDQEVVQSYVVIGPLAAALAAWLAARDRRRRVEGLAGTMPGTGVQRDALAFATATIWGLSGYACVFAWHARTGLMEATWGGPDLRLIATGALAIMLFASIGILISRFVSGKFSPLLALVVTFLLTIGSDAFKMSAGDGSYRQPLKLLMPWGLVTENHPTVFTPYSAPFALEAVVWLLGATGVVLALVALNRRRSIAGVIGLALAAGVAGSGAAVLVEHGEPWLGWSGPVDFDRSCQAQAGVEVCVHPAYEASLAAASEVVGAIVVPLAGLDGVPERWVQNSLAQPERGTGQLWQLEPPMIQWAVVDQIFPVDGAAGPMAMRPSSQLVFLHWLMVGSSQDFDGTWPFGWPVEVPHTDARRGQGMYTPAMPDSAALAAFAPEVQAAVDRFAALSPEEQRAWLEANWDALRDGDLTLEDLP